MWYTIIYVRKIYYQTHSIVMSVNNYEYDYPFSTPAENAVNKRIIERPYANHLKFFKTAVFVVCQRDNHDYEL